MANHFQNPCQENCRQSLEIITNSKAIKRFFLNAKSLHHLYYIQGKNGRLFQYTIEIYIVLYIVDNIKLL